MKKRQSTPPPLPEKKEPRGTRVDGFAGVLLLFGLVISVAIFSEDFSQTSKSDGNLLGPTGSFWATKLYSWLGMGVYVLLASWFVGVLFLFLRKSWLTWSLRAVGWIILIPCSALILDWLGPDRVGGPPQGSGSAVVETA